MDGDKRLPFERTVAQDGIRPGKGRGLPAHIYSNLEISRELLKSRLRARAPEPPSPHGRPPAQALFNLTPFYLSPHLLQVLRGLPLSTRTRTPAPPLRRSHRLCARVLPPGSARSPPSSLPRPLRPRRAGLATGDCAAHPAKWRRQHLAVLGTEGEPVVSQRATRFTFLRPLVPRRPPNKHNHLGFFDSPEGLGAEFIVSPKVKLEVPETVDYTHYYLLERKDVAAGQTYSTLFLSLCRF